MPPVPAMIGGTAGRRGSARSDWSCWVLQPHSEPANLSDPPESPFSPTTDSPWNCCKILIAIVGGGSFYHSSRHSTAAERGFQTLKLSGQGNGLVQKIVGRAFTSHHVLYFALV